MSTNAMKNAIATSSADTFVAEHTSGSRADLRLLRWALVIVFLWFGGMKFTSYEANGVAPFMINSPLMSWLVALLGIHGASYLLGLFELATAAALAFGSCNSLASAAGAAMSSCTFFVTLTFFLTTPGVSEATAGGFPAISAAPGQFLLKDIVLLAASLNLLFASMPNAVAFATSKLVGWNGQSKP